MKESRKKLLSVPGSPTASHRLWRRQGRRCGTTVSWIVAHGIGTALIEPRQARMVSRQASRQVSHAQRVRGARSKTSEATGGTLRYMGNSRPAPRRRAERCGTAPRPVARPCRRDTCSRRRKPSQANRSPKNQGRSRFASSVTTFILWTGENSPASGSGWARVRNCNAGWSHQGI
jgi:hypothetical protein